MIWLQEYRLYSTRIFPCTFSLSALLAFSCLISVLISCSENAKVHTAKGTVEMSQDELMQTLGQAYLFGYPLVLMDLTRQVSTNIEHPHPERPLAPINQLGHFRRFPDHTLRTVVKPNVDTYYSIAWMHLDEEPLVLSLPETERYYLMQMLDAYSNVFASIGPRTTGTDPIDILVTGPGWEGVVPQGMLLVRAPTSLVWMLGRIQVNSVEDGATKVRDIQDHMRLVPLKHFDDPDYEASKGRFNKDMVGVIPSDMVRNLDIREFFNRMSHLMAENPPPAKDSTIVRKMSGIGLDAGQPFKLSTDHLILRKKIEALSDYVHNRLEERRAHPDTSLLVNGWMIARKGIGAYGTDYTRRAFIAFMALGANLPEDAVYPNCTQDVNGDPLDGSNQYVLHFAADQMPPVNAFWSVTAYGADEFLVENTIGRYALGDRDTLRYNPDGSLDILVQSVRPAEKNLSNWLPIPANGPFSLTLRLYWPKTEVLSGDWSPPSVVPVDRTASLPK